MTADQFIAAGIRLFGRRHWKVLLAEALGVDPSTIHRLAGLGPKPIPGPYEVAVKGMVAFKVQEDQLAKLGRQIQRKNTRIEREKTFRQRVRRKEKNDGRGSDIDTASGGQVSVDEVLRGSGEVSLGKYGAGARAEDE